MDIWARRGLLLGGICGLAVLAAVLGDVPPSVAAAQPHDLRQASLDQIAQYAVAVTRAHYRVVGGTPAAAVVRRTDATELEAFGFGQIHLYCGEPPMVLAVVAGDLELTDAPLRPPAAPPVHIAAVAFVFIESNGKEVGETWAVRA